MAAPTTSGLTPQEVAFLAENEAIGIVPRQRLEALQLLSGPIPALNPPQRTTVPLWFALLLKRQQRANIVTPPWLTVDSLSRILDFETELPTFTSSTPLQESSATGSTAGPVMSPPFIPTSTPRAPSDALPYHWLEIATLLLEGASDDIEEADNVRRLVRDLRECRAAKMRKVTADFEGNKQVALYGVSAMEICEHRGFMTGVVDGLRKIGASREATRREREEEEGRAAGRRGADDDDDSDDDMGL